MSGRRCWCEWGEQQGPARLLSPACLLPTTALPRPYPPLPLLPGPGELATANGVLHSHVSSKDSPSKGSAVGAGPVGVLDGVAVTVQKVGEDGRPLPDEPGSRGKPDGGSKTWRTLSTWLSRQWAPANTGFGDLEKEPRWGAPYLTQISILFRRSIRTRRFETMSNQVGGVGGPGMRVAGLG